MHFSNVLQGPLPIQGTVAIKTLPRYVCDKWKPERGVLSAALVYHCVFLLINIAVEVALHLTKDRHSQTDVLSRLG